MLKQPHSANLSCNPIAFSFAISNYGRRAQQDDIRMSVRVFVEKSFGSGSFEEVDQRYVVPDGNGMIQFDIHTVIDAWLKYFTPRPTLANLVNVDSQYCRFYINYGLFRNGLPAYGPYDTSPYVALKGGLSTEEWHPSNFVDKNILTDRRPLHFYQRRRFVTVDEAHYLFWAYPLDDEETQVLRIEVKWDDFSTSSFSKPATGPTKNKFQVCCAPVGFTVHDLGLLAPAGRTARSYKAWVETDEASPRLTAAPVVYELDYRAFTATRYLYYRNSLGALEALRLRGQIDFDADYDRQQVRRVNGPDWYQDGLLKGETSDAAIDEVLKLKGDTGWISKPEADGLRDLFLAPQVYELADGRLQAVTLITKSAKFFTNRDNLISVAVEWQRSLSNERYSTPQLIAADSTCPAMVDLDFVQVSRNRMQILWSLPFPYDRVEIKIRITGQPDQTFLFEGNSGSKIVTFNNPATLITGPVLCRVIGRVVCDLYNDDFGPELFLDNDVNPELPPIAADDTFDINTGYSGAFTLPGSALDNDASQDDDDIEVVATSGSTAAGGSYAIDAAGIITYTPPSSAFRGQDHFTYDVRVVGGTLTSTATCFIRVGLTVGAIFARCVKRNLNITDNSGVYAEEGDWYLCFYSDAACTIPVNTSPYNLTINYERKDYVEPNTTITNHTLSASGTEMFLYNGNIVITWRGIFTAQPDEAYTFRTLAGIGYFQA